MAWGVALSSSAPAWDLWDRSVVADQDPSTAAVHGTSTSAVISPGGGGETGGAGGTLNVQAAARSGNPNPKPGLAGFSGGVDKLSSFGKREVMRDVLGVKVERQTELFET